LGPGYVVLSEFNPRVWNTKATKVWNTKVTRVLNTEATRVWNTKARSLSFS